MIKGIISYYDGKRTAVTCGPGEDVRAPRELKALEASGWVIDEQVETYYKAFLAARRQGDVPKDTDFIDWIDSVEEIDLRPTAKQIEQAVAFGSMTREQADGLLKVLGDVEGEAGQPHA